MLEDIKKHILNSSSSKNRRAKLNEHMSELIEKKHDCFSCIGHCCTFEFNSMQISLLEAFDIYDYLLLKDMITDNLILQLKSNIEHFRLDKEFYTPTGKKLRRYYTCPFYQGSGLGCSIGKHNKPYGCLGFNPLMEKVTIPGNCTSYTNKLEVREKSYRVIEQELNEYLSKELQLANEKASISSQLLKLVQAFSNR